MQCQSDSLSERSCECVSSPLHQAVAMVCGFLVVIALVVIAVFAHKTRGKIWRYGKPNIHWDEPLTRGPDGRDVEDWVSVARTAYTADVSSHVHKQLMLFWQFKV